MSRHKDMHFDPYPATCTECGKDCTAVQRDCGFGLSEYWGATSVDHDWQIVSDCCEAPVGPERIIDE